MGFTFISTACIPRSNCRDASWAAPLGIILALVFFVILAVTSGKEPDGLFIVLLFFYQLSPLVNLQAVEVTSASALQAVFGLAPPEQAGGKHWHLYNSRDDSSTETVHEDGVSGNGVFGWT
jgi:hypothetical protein